VRCQGWAIYAIDDEAFFDELQAALSGGEVVR
jgi:hypothetical protein